MIKLLLYTLANKKKNKNCIILIDPHGDLADQTSKIFERGRVNNRLIYIDPSERGDDAFYFNPFQINDKSEENIDIVTQQLVGAFEEILHDVSLTINMRTILAPCIATLLRRNSSSTLAELQRFMDDGNNMDLIQLGLNSPVKQHSEFFRNGFRNSYYSNTKRSIYTKIQSLINHPIFADIITNPYCSINLEQAIEDKSVIIFGLSKGKIGKEASATLGRLIIARLQGIVMMRARIKESKRVPIFAFIDECHNFISQTIEEIICESRKYGLHLILAQQILGQGMNTSLKDIVLSNTAVKFTGMNSSQTLSYIAKDTGTEVKDFLRLRTGEFIVKAGVRGSFKYKVSNLLLNKGKLIDWYSIIENIFIYPSDAENKIDRKSKTVSKRHSTKSRRNIKTYTSIGKKRVVKANFKPKYFL